MRHTKSNTSNFFRQQFTLLMMALLILLAPCSVKSQLKNMMGLPTQTEMNTVDKTNSKTNSKASFSTSENCVVTQESAVKNTLAASSSKTLDVLPVFLIALSFVCFFTRSSHRQNITSPYEKKRIIPALPIFLQFRQLII